MVGNIVLIAIGSFVYLGILIWIFQAWEWLNPRLRLNDGYEWSKKWFVRLWALLGLALWNLFFYFVSFILIMIPLFIIASFIDWT